MKRTLALTLFLLAAVAFLSAQDKVEFKTIDGVPHAFNPALPLKGTIKLEVERTRTIDPYTQSDVGMRMILFTRDSVGSVILYDPNGAEGHRFGPSGEYLGVLTRKGQGPGEFSPGMPYYAFFAESKICVFGGQKVALLDGDGKFLQDKVLKNRFSTAVDAGHFLSTVTSWTESKDQIRTVKLVNFSMDGEEVAVDLFQAEKVGQIRHPSGQGGLIEGWGTPNVFSAGDGARKRVFCGLNTEYKIWVKDYSGKDLLVIQKDHKNAKATRADVEKLMSGAFKNERLKWLLDAFPDRFVAIKDVVPLPQGYLAIFRVTGPGVLEIDIFDPKGQYLYALIPPAGVRLDLAQFFATGFATIDESEDSSVYREYRIRNLPEIFGR